MAAYVPHIRSRACRNTLKIHLNHSVPHRTRSDGDAKILNVFELKNDPALKAQRADE